MKILDAYYMSSGIVYFFINFKKINNARKRIQSNKVKNSDKNIKRLVVTRSLWYFINKATKKHKIGNASSY